MYSRVYASVLACCGVIQYDDAKNESVLSLDASRTKTANEPPPALSLRHVPVFPCPSSPALPSALFKPPRSQGQSDKHNMLNGNPIKICGQSAVNEDCGDAVKSREAFARHS